MSSVANGLRLTVPEAAYLAAHEGWMQPELNVIVAIGVSESQLNTTEYRPISLNPAGGNDMSFLMLNDKWHPKPDPFTRFHPLIALADALVIWQKHGFSPWSYPSARRNDTTLNLAAITIEIGPSPGDIANSPYWRLIEAGIDPMDLPQPPQGEYVSRLPPAPLRYGNHGAFTQAGVVYPDTGITFEHGPAINQLQRLLVEMTLYPGGVDEYYGPRTRGTIVLPKIPTIIGVAALQIQLRNAHLWTGAIDGQYTTELRDVWDGALRFDHWRRGR